jgi:hypothetical protein
MKTFAEIGTEIGQLVDGLQPEQYGDALLQVRIFDKQKRIATDRDALGESPYEDISGYGILGAHMHQNRKAAATWQGTANADAGNSSEVKPHDSAEPNASEGISQSANATTVHEPLPQPGGCCETPASAPAPTATAAASPSAADLYDINLRQAKLLEFIVEAYPKSISDDVLKVRLMQIGMAAWDFESDLLDLEAAGLIKCHPFWREYKAATKAGLEVIRNTRSK